jgi:hypothetical protein
LFSTFRRLIMSSSTDSSRKDEDTMILRNVENHSLKRHSITPHEILILIITVIKLMKNTWPRHVAHTRLKLHTSACNDCTPAVYSSISDEIVLPPLRDTRRIQDVTTDYVTERDKRAATARILAHSIPGTLPSGRTRQYLLLRATRHKRRKHTSSVLQLTNESA